VDKGIFLGYSDTSKAFKVFNSRTIVMEEFIHVKFNDGLITDEKLSNLEDDFANMQIGPFVAPKIDKVKQSDETPPQSRESSSQQL